MTLIEQAGDALVTSHSRFRHSFEAPVARIRPDPDQPRKLFAEEDLVALAATMAEQGQLQPVLLRRDPEQRGSYILVAGERRWRASRLNGWETILAIEHEGDSEVATLLENLQRVDLSPVEEAKGLQRLIKGKGWTQAHAAEALGKTKGEISASLKILTLPEPVLAQVLTSELDIPRNALVELARIEDPGLVEELLAAARAGTLTVRTIRAARETSQVPCSADTDEGRTPAAEQQVSHQSLPRFSFRSLDRIAVGLRLMRTLGKPLRPADRERLEALREEVEELLRGAEDGSEASDLATSS
jgi:ParB family chromosome partitioning protein